jgi:DNA-binding XRE family transcriptional regulator
VTVNRWTNPSSFSLTGIPRLWFNAAMDGTRSPLRTLREARGLGLRELARRAGVDPGALSRAESGQRAPSVRLLGRLAPLLGARDLQQALRVLARYGVRT